MRQIRWGIGKLVVRRPTEIPVEDCKDRTTRSLCRLKHKVRIAYTRDELDNTILQQLSEKMSPEQFNVNDLAKMKSALAWLTTLQLNSENFDLNKRKFTIRPALGTAGHWNTSHLSLLAGRDLTLIMQCLIWRADLSIGGMTTCETCSHPFSWAYAMVLRSDLDRRCFNQQCQLLWWSSFGSCQCADQWICNNFYRCFYTVIIFLYNVFNKVVTLKDLNLIVKLTVSMWRR